MVQLQNGKHLGMLQILVSIFLKHTVHILASLLPSLSCYNLVIPKFYFLTLVPHIKGTIN